MKILVTGPESSGKSTLSRALAWCLDGLYVAEQARQYLHERHGAYTEADLPLIWSVQRAAEDRATAEGTSYVICDTGPEVIQIWSLVKFGQVPTPVTEAVRERLYDLTFLCAPDLPWQADPLRESPDLATRQSLFQRYERLLPEALIIRGEERVSQALRALSEHSLNPRTRPS